ncbi:unnamed protein product [Trifolium pratense]|uniref:Uncharacterized protein n=1 Tax=Trifolium pratense TaxID=57577 RepID=A0ACB0L667_TRIPR|nr:unnamed protein product [Trifolium pratense]
MDPYCNQYNLDVSQVGFLFDGRFVQAKQTPHEDGKAIFVCIFVCIDRSTQLKTLVKAYCDHHSVDLNSVTFWFDGNQLQGDHSHAEQLHMNDGDEIDVIFYDPNAYVKLKVSLNFKGKIENEYFSNVRRSNQLKNLMDDYCRRYWLDIDGVAFLFNGCLLRAEQTPDELQLVNGDEIDVVFYDQLARMKLKVKCQVGFEGLFRINRSTRLKMLMDVYCRRYCFDFNEDAFLFNGRLIEADQTPDELKWF